MKKKVTIMTQRGTFSLSTVGPSISDVLFATCLFLVPFLYQTCTQIDSLHTVENKRKSYLPFSFYNFLDPCVFSSSFMGLVKLF